MSAIKWTLIDDGYDWDNNRVLLGTLTRACKTLNDQIRTRLPIHKWLLELLIFEIERLYHSQPYMKQMYKTFFLIVYYRMFRPGELAMGDHTVKAKDVHIAKNKKKILFILYSSKTHGKNKKPQKIKIAASQDAHMGHQRKQFVCPFLKSREYLAIRGNFKTDQDPFFVQSDHSPVMPHQVRAVLRKLLSSINLNAQAYNLHSFRVGRTTDMYQYSYSIEQIRIAGR